MDRPAAKNRGQKNAKDVIDYAWHEVKKHLEVKIPEREAWILDGSRKTLAPTDYEGDAVASQAQGRAGSATRQEAEDPSRTEGGSVGLRSQSRLDKVARALSPSSLPLQKPSKRFRGFTPRQRSPSVVPETPDQDEEERTSSDDPETPPPPTPAQRPRASHASSSASIRTRSQSRNSQSPARSVSNFSASKLPHAPSPLARTSEDLVIDAIMGGPEDDGEREDVIMGGPNNGGEGKAGEDKQASGLLNKEILVSTPFLLD